MAIDLRDAARTGGAVHAVVELLLKWWKIDGANGLTDPEDLCAFLRERAYPRLPWPQDRLLPSTQNIALIGLPLIAVESESLWKATVVSENGESMVNFHVELPVPVLPKRMELAEFLLRIVVEAAVRSANPQYRCRTIPGVPYQRVRLLAAREIEPRLVCFPDIVAGPGWFGIANRPPSRAHLATQLPSDELVSRSRDWSTGWDILAPASAEVSQDRGESSGARRFRWQPIG